MTASIAQAPTALDDAIIRNAEATLETVGRAREAIHTVIFGQEEVVDLTLITLLAGGHGLLVGVPGLAKTKLVETLGTVLGLDARRIQFTPDLMPSDILGSEILDEGADRRRSFRFVKGPIFAQLLMADEINRASPRTQSALLQAMQEHHVSVGGERHDLPQPFHVLATQNPIEQEGTYPLPEAQLDRFLLEIDVGYPDREAERRILIETTGVEDHKPRRVMNAEALMNAQRLVRRLPVGESVVEAILDLVRSARPGGERRRRRHRQAPLGSGSARQPGADAGGARPRAHRGPRRALHRRRGGARRAGAQAPHGADLLRPRRWGDDPERHRPPDRAAGRLGSASWPASGSSPKAPARRDAARPKTPSRWPSGCRASSSRRGASPPTSPTASTAAGAPASARRFWQFRPFVAGEAAQRIDWRRSARDDRLYVREREWETAQTIWFWIDRSASMGFASDLAQAPKIERALVLGLALADAFVEGGERVGLLGLMAPRAIPAHRRDHGRRPWSRTAPRSKTTCRPDAPVATARRSHPDQRFPVARARHRRHGRGHLGPRCARPSRS